MGRAIVLRLPMDVLERLKEVAEGFGVYDIGVADADAWSTDSLVSERIREEERPNAIMPSARSVIVIGIPVQSTILDTAPSIYYSELYKTVNQLLDTATERIALELIHMGYHAVYVPRDGYQGIEGLKRNPASLFSHRHAAYLAGLGTFGYNNMLLTKRYGPRIRFSSVITDAPLPYGRPMTENLCIGCARCTKACPKGAVGDKYYPDTITKKTLCVENSADLRSKGISPCGRCIAVCPVGGDRIEGPTEAAIRNIRSFVKD